jgi:GST-like protein
MIELYTAATGNGQRPALILEELGLDYTIRKVDLAKGEQRSAQFLRLNPRGQIPVVVDDDGPEGERLVLAQSYAILLHYAMKHGRFIPKDAGQKALMLQYLFAVASDAAPTSGGVFALQNFVPEKVESTAEFFIDRLMASFRYFDQRLGQSEYLAGPEITVADLALYPVYAARKALIAERGGLKNLERWAATVGARPAVQKGMAVPG